MYLLYESRATKYSLSISNVGEDDPTIREIIRSLLAEVHIDGSKTGFYDSRNADIGFYATVRSDWSYDGAPHAFMLGRSDEFRTLLNKPHLDLALSGVLGYVVSHEDWVLEQGHAHRIEREKVRCSLDFLCSEL